MCAPILPRPMKPMSMALILPRICLPRICLRGGQDKDVSVPDKPAAMSEYRRGGAHKLRAYLFGVLAERGHRAVASGFAGPVSRRRRVRDRAARRADGDAAQMRVTRQIRRT